MNLIGKVIDVIKHPVAYSRGVICEIKEGMRARAWARSMAKSK